jgi:hypothetical protein
MPYGALRASEPVRRLLLPYAVRLRIAGEHAGGKSLNALAVGLNAEGVPTAKGARWYA